MAIEDSSANAALQACMKNPQFMATILNMMGNVIEDTAPASRDGEVVVWQQLQSLETTITSLLETHSETNSAEFAQLRELIASIQGMSAAQVESLIRQILAEQYSPEQIESIIIAQAGGLISALQDGLESLSGRVSQLEIASSAQAQTIALLGQSAIAQQDAIDALRNQDSSILNQFQALSQSILTYSFLCTDGGVITELENLGVNAVEVHCDTPDFINYIVRTPRRIKCLEGVLESRGGMGVTLGHARLPIDAVEVKDIGLTYGQKHMITIPRAESIRVLMD
jgi:uncharacterized coiled-coil protein SlyX